VAREVKNSQLKETTGKSESVAKQPEDSIQLSLDLNLQKTAVGLIREDFSSAKLARDERDYGFDAKGSRLDFERWRKDLLDLYFGKREPKTKPWRFASNRSMMIMMAIVEVLHARLFAATYNEELTRWRPGEVTDEDKIERIEKLMFWWVRVRSKLRDFFDRWVRMVIGFGGILTETTWDVQFIDKGEFTQPEPVTDELGQPVVGEDGLPTTRPPEKVLERFEKSRSDIIPIEDVFLQPGATDIQRDPVIIQQEFFYRELEQMEAQGQLINVSKPSVKGARTLKDVLPVTGLSGEGLDEDELEELTNIKRRNIPVTIHKWYGGIDVDKDGFPEQVRLWANLEWEVYLGGVPLSAISKRGMRHLDITMFMPRIDEPQGLIGLGVIEQAKELALEIDAIFNQMTDANTLSVLRPGFYDPSGDLDAGALNLAPNKMHPVSNPSQNVFFPDFNIPTEKLIVAIRMVLEFIERLTAASSYILGKESETVGGSGTATRVNQIVSSAEQRFSIPAGRLRDGAARIMTQHLDLVQLNLPPGLEKRVLGQKGEQIFGDNELSQEGISGEFDAYLLPDDSLGSKEVQRQLSQFLYQILLPNIIVGSDPAKVYKITADLLKSYGRDPEKYLGPSPIISDILDPADEHTLVLQGDFDKVVPTIAQNHLDHLLEHQAFLQDPAFLQLEINLQQQIAQFLTAHIQQHMQMIQLLAQAQAQLQKGGKKNVGGNGAQGGTASATAPVGTEPGVGTSGNPSQQGNRIQRTGESQIPR